MKGGNGKIIILSNCLVINSYDEIGYFVANILRNV